MKILIIGGTGLISTSITRQLMERGGDDVTLYNRGRSEARAPGGWKQIVGDRKDFAHFEQQMRDAGTFDCVMDMIGFLPDEVESAARAFKGRVGQYIFCSTVDVYGKPATRYPYREDEPLSGLGDYAINKVKCENVLAAAQERGDLPVTIIRPAYTYGEGGVIIHSFGWSTAYVDRIRKGKPIVVHGDGNSLWVALHIDDEARAFINAAGNAQAIGKAYHTTGETWMTWNQYHQGVARALGAPEPALTHIPSTLLARISPQRAGVCAVNFQFNNIFDNSAARADLGFAQTISWEEGARRTVDWLASRNRIANSDDDPFDDRVIAAWQRLGDRMAEELTVND
jgi:nucleoside-diphosphate-sugar epimerase